jgi:hypothetical protein
MKRTTRKSSSKSSSKKVKYTFDTKSNVIMEDKSSPNVNIKFIFDKDEPFYKHIFKGNDNGTSNN